MIRNHLGSTLKIDTNTLTTQRGKFAKMAVEINIEKPLVVSFLIEGEEQRVENENLPSVCFTCGRISHRVKTCADMREKVRGHDVEQTKRDVMEVEKEAGVETSNRGGSKFGPWIHVQKKNRRQPSGKGIGRQSKTKDNTSKSKEETTFSMLNKLIEEPEEELRIGSGNIGHRLTGDKTKEAQQKIGRNKGIEKGKEDHAKIRGCESHNKKIERSNKAEGSSSREITCNQNGGREENGSLEANEVFLQDLRKAMDLVGVIDREK